jgi:histone deacetylase complex regulatory component SIN3
MNSKSLIIEIETLYREQRDRHYRRPVSVPVPAPTTRYQLDFAFKDLSVFEDANKAITTFMSVNLGLNSADDVSFKNFLKTFVNKFFLVEEKPSISKLSSNEVNGESKPSKDVVMTDVDAAAKTSETSSRNAYSFYANTNFYVFFRLYQV